MSTRRRHLLAIEGMTRGEIEPILDRARFHRQRAAAGTPAQTLAGKVVLNAFFEDSTRTRASFEIAAKSLGAQVVNWLAKVSSIQKGETLFDTARNLDAVGVNALVIRHASSGAAYLLAQVVRCAVVNAGDGTHEHPSQALLDAFTLREHLGPLQGRRVLIVGDILHSRVARSNVHCLQALGASVTVCGPPTLLPPGMAELGCTVTEDLDAALPSADAVMMLRLQNERQAEALFPSAREFSRGWGLTVRRAERLLPHAIVLHPGPINREVEIASSVADGPRSVILEQVTNGVAVRMAILEEACA